MKIEDVFGAGKVGAEAVKQVVEVVKEPVSNLVNPVTETAGQRLSEIVNLVFTPIELAKIYKDHKLDIFKDSLNAKIDLIPEDKRVSPPLNIVGPALEAAKFYIEDESLREMFAELIASAMNSDKAGLAHPSFEAIIRQLSPLDAKFISMFKYQSTYPTCDLQATKEGTVTPFINTLFDFKERQIEFSNDEYLNLTSSLDNLMRLGMIFKNMEILTLDYDYEIFKNSSVYEECVQVANNNDLGMLKILKSRIELTSFGWNFFKCCIAQEN